MRTLMTTLGCLCCLLLFSTQSMGQDRRGMNKDDIAQAKEKLEAQKVAFITTQLDMTTEEAQDFWPIYNEFQENMKSLRKSRKEAYDQEEDPNKQLDQFFEMEESMLDLKKEFAGKVRSSIGAEKALQLLHLEKRFAKNVLEKYKNRMKDRKHDGFRNGR